MSHQIGIVDGWEMDGIPFRGSYNLLLRRGAERSQAVVREETNQIFLIR